MSREGRTIRLKVSPQVAQLVAAGTPREEKLKAARGARPLAARDQLMALCFFCHEKDGELSRQARQTLRTLPVAVLQPVLDDNAAHPQLLDLIARLRLQERPVIGPLLGHPAVAEHTLIHIAAYAPAEVLTLLVEAEESDKISPAIAKALRGNPHASGELRRRLEEKPEAYAASKPGAGASLPHPAEQERDASDESPAMAGEAEELNLSKYQQALVLGVAEKIRIAMTGDKEWRSLFLKDTNKLVCTAALRNPRITDGEVLAVTRNKSASEELIRLITLNKEWVKNLEIKKALILHPKTPLPKALRYLHVLGEKDLKTLAKSRGVSQVLVSNARRLLLAREKKA